MLLNRIPTCFYDGMPLDRTIFVYSLGRVFVDMGKFSVHASSKKWVLNQFEQHTWGRPGFL